MTDDTPNSFLETFFKKILQKFNQGDGRRKQRIIIIHNHLFKNAGTTIDWALKNNFKNRFVDHRDDENMKKGAAYLGPYLAENPDVLALSTHHLRFPLPTLRHTKILIMTMYRHPIERVSSVYNFERKQETSNTPGAEYARSHSLSEYVNWRMRLDVPGTIRNFHINKSIPHPVKLNKKTQFSDLKAAEKFVDNNAMTGFVNRFDESMVLFEENLRPYFPNIDLSYKIQNANQKLDGTIEQRVEKLKNEIGGKNFNSLIEHNQLDLSLYDYALEQFDNRLKKISDFDGKLNEFKLRCEKYN